MERHQATNIDHMGLLLVTATTSNIVLYLSISAVILPVLDFLNKQKAQRDRFRNRIKELEAEREDEQREARGARAVMESLQRDNLQLYEKVG